MVDRDFFLTMVAFALLLLYLWLVFAILAPLQAALIWALVIGVASFPLYRRLRSRLRERHTLAAAIMTPAVVVLLAIPTGLVLIFLALELDALYDTIQVRILTGDYPTLQQVGSWPLLANILEFLRPITEDVQINLRETLVPAFQNMVGNLMENFQKAAGGLIYLALQGAVMVITLFFFFRDGERLINLFSSLIPLSEDRKTLLFEKTEEVLSAVLYGVFLTAFVQGILAFLGYWIVGLPSPALLGIVTAIASIIPPLGTALVWFPAAVYLFFSGEGGNGLILLVWGTMVVATSDNIIRPYFISGRGRISFLTVLLGILGGLATFGLTGLVIGPIILALFLSIAEIYRPLLPESENQIVRPR